MAEHKYFTCDRCSREIKQKPFRGFNHCIEIEYADLMAVNLLYEFTRLQNAIKNKEESFSISLGVECLVMRKSYDLCPDCKKNLMKFLDGSDDLSLKEECLLKR